MAENGASALQYGGMFLWVTCPESLDTDRRGEEGSVKIDVRPRRSFFVGLNFSHVTLGRIHSTEPDGGCLRPYNFRPVNLSGLRAKELKANVTSGSAAETLFPQEERVS